MFKACSVQLWKSSFLANPPSHLDLNTMTSQRKNWAAITLYSTYPSAIPLFGVSACVCAYLSAIHNILCLLFDLVQPMSLSGTKEHTLLISILGNVKDRAEIILLQTFHNADVQLNCNSAWLFGSLFTPTTLLQSHTSNYLRAGVSTYGYDSFRLTTAINRGARDQNCSSESVTDDRYGKRFSMICAHGGEGAGVCVCVCVWGGGLQGTERGKKREVEYRMKMKNMRRKIKERCLSTWGSSAKEMAKTETF